MGAKNLRLTLQNDLHLVPAKAKKGAKILRLES